MNAIIRRTRKTKPMVVHSNIDPKRMSGGEIDRKVGRIFQAGKDLYSHRSSGAGPIAADLMSS